MPQADWSEETLRMPDNTQASPASLVSVVVPVYNTEQYLGPAIESILAQTYQALEIVVVDDGSEDASLEVARSFAQVRCFNRPHQGQAVARNFGAKECRGQFISFLDADDLWLPTKLELQVTALKADPGLDMVFGQIEEFHSPDLSPEECARVKTRPGPLPGLSVEAMLIRQESWERAGPFPTEYRVGEFMDWYVRARESGLKSFILTELVVRRRIHLDNLGRRAKDMRADYLRIIKKSLDRRRQSATGGPNVPPDADQ